MKYSAMQKISSNTRKIMEEKKVTSTMLAYKTNLGIMTISNMLTCKNEPKISTLALIAKGLKVDIRDLLKGIKTEEMI